MGIVEKTFCDLTEYYYFKCLPLKEALNKATKLLGKERGDKYE